MIRGTAHLLITVTGGYQCEVEAFIRSFDHSFPSLYEAQTAPGIVLGIGGTEMQRWIDKVQTLQSLQSGGRR